MAEALVSIAVKVVGKQLAEVVGQQLSPFAGATRELEKLSGTFQSITAVLDDAESRQVGEKLVQLWLSKLRHAAYDVEDLLEDASNHAVSGYNVPRRIKDRYNVGHRIKEFKERLDQIDADRNRFCFRSSTQGRDQRELVRSQQRLPTSVMDESEMVIVRVDDKETLVSRLVRESSSHEANRSQVHVLAIAGIGGLGKTTLAQLVCNDREVRGHFKKAVYWVCVSDVFDVIRLTKAILEEVKGKNNFPSELNALQKELLEALSGKRFLLVLDDVWTDDAEEWKLLRRPLTSGANGSRILVTTRSEKVANTLKANYIHKLEGLSDDHSWSLFSSKAFAGKKPEEYLEFVNVGREIVNNCHGVPLLISVIGSAMYCKKTLEDWQNVLNSKILSLRDVAGKIRPALLLTYCNLPARLKQCFAYCSMFPKDWVYEKDVLVKLWVAQGFVQSDEKREKEDIGDEYFDELVAWSMFQEIQEDDGGKIKYKMHDMLHDLAEFIAKDENYTFISNSKGGQSEECSGSSSSCDVRHAYLYFSGSDDKPSKIPNAARRAKKLRTLWFGGIDESDSGIIDLIHQARFLRALYFPNSTRLPKSIGKLKHLTYLCLPGSKMVKLPDAIGKMQQLRYLDLNGNSNIVELPESVSDLRNLHTLNLGWCRKLAKLPRGIGGMEKLRHLDLSYNSIVKLPDAIGKMQQLRYLDLYGNSDIVELPESVSDLRNLHTLNLGWCGKLAKLPRGIGGMEKLRHLDLSYNSIVKLPDAIGKMQQLRYLHLSDNSNLLELPESVSDLRNLHTLNLRGCGKLEKLPRGIGGMVNLRYLHLSDNSNLVELPESVSDLRNLHTLDLSRCGKLEKLPWGIGGMENLRDLDLSHNSNLVELPESASDLCNLQTLNLSDCGKLEKLPRGIGGMVNLRDLDLSNNSNLVELPESVSGLSMLHTLNLHGCGKLEKLPKGIGGMKRLRDLDLSHNSNLVELPESASDLRNLQTLDLSTCGKLEKLPRGIGGMVSLRYLDLSYNSNLVELPESVSDLRILHRLNLNGCEKLEQLPRGIGGMVNLRDLHLSLNSNIVELLESASDLRNLHTLELSGCEELVLSSDVKLERLPHLSSLREFKISGLRNEILPGEGWERLVALRKLEIFDCAELKCLPEGLTQLPSLKQLRIDWCVKLESLPERLGQLRKLKSLQVCVSFDPVDCETLRCLPDSVGELESLESLEIMGCPNLESLPDSLGRLKALKRLKIQRCEALASLPQALRHLSLLRLLCIYDCPLLSERCECEGGVDWPNISHIPNIFVNGEGLQGRFRGW